MALLFEAQHEDPPMEPPGQSGHQEPLILAARMGSSSREDEATCRAISDMIPLPVAIIRRHDGLFLYANELLGLMLGLPPAQLQGHTIQEFCAHPADRETLLGAVSTKTAHNTYEFLTKKTNSVPLWVEVSLRHLLFQDQEAALLTFHNITVQKLLEQELDRSKRLDIVGRLTSGVAHDFNNLLTVILGWSEIAATKLSENDPLRKSLEEIKKAGYRASSLTRQLLSFSSRHEKRPQVLDLNHIVAAMDTMLQRLIGEDIHLETALDPVPGHIKADPSQVEQIIMNLVVNARDAMPQGGKLSLKTAHVEINAPHVNGLVVEPGSYVLLTVTDSGHGMDAETESRIFEPFFTTKGPGKGTGLGLANVSGIMKQLGGHIRVQSERGRGSTFTIYFPKADANSQPALTDPLPSKLPQGTETILLVEDDPGIRELVREMLQISGYTVLEARHGIEAWMIGKQYAGPIHLLVTDVVMPQMSGHAVADRLTPLHPEMRVLYISGYTDDAISHHGVVDSGQDFLQKPFNPAILVQKVRDLLDTPPRR
ncbi:MAG: PAS domain-containing hybrid sensor histidine kinase/response regulator [Nitrospirae bacterium]|nr:MAG: PAS domain-containing hybrid sensor histidine kinase/response regulator [Nitrospirota bacterium]